MPGPEALSSEQFGGQVSGTLPQPHRAQDNLQDRGDRTPLPEAANTQGTARARTAWRLEGVQPWSKATAGTTYNPDA